MIELDGVSKYFGDEAAVDGISLTIPDGSLCVLVGTSGCGKSTTLRMINRLIEHNAGEIRIDGHQIRSFNEEALRRRIGYAIQNTGLFPHWTVSRNIGVVPRLLKWDRVAIERRVEMLMELLDLDIDEFADKYPHQLSGGQAQRSRCSWNCSISISMSLLINTRTNSLADRRSGSVWRERLLPIPRFF